MNYQISTRTIIQKSLTMLATIFFFLVMGTTSNAATIADWDFSGLNQNVTSDTPVTNPVLTSSLSNVVTGLTSTDLIGSAGLQISSGSPAAGEANLKNWDLNPGDGVNDNYLEFTLTADNAGGLTINSISVSEWRNGGAAPDGIAFEVSVDSGAFVLYDAVQVDAASGSGPSFDLFTFSESITGATTVAIRYAPRRENAGHSGNQHINGLSVAGSVQAVPEPSTFVLLIVGVIGFFGYTKFGQKTTKVTS